MDEARCEPGLFVFTNRKKGTNVARMKMYALHQSCYQAPSVERVVSGRINNACFHLAEVGERLIERKRKLETEAETQVDKDIDSYVAMTLEKVLVKKFKEEVEEKTD